MERLAGESVVLLLNSAARIRKRDARYSFLTAAPVFLLSVSRAQYGVDPFERLREWQSWLPELGSDLLPPFCGGIAGLMSYELGEAFERLPRPEISDFETPALLAGLFDWCIVWDHIESTVKAYVLRLRDERCLPDSPDHHQDNRRRQKERIEWVRQRFVEPSGHGQVGVSEAADVSPPEKGAQKSEYAGLPRSRVSEHLSNPVNSEYRSAPRDPEVRSNFTRQQYVETVGRVVEYIRAGDIFQANLSQRLVAEWSAEPEELYRRVRQLNPAPFCAMLKAPGLAIVSASPERFLKVHRGRYVETRPIKGTRRRQRSPIADLYTTDELTSSEKDRAENVMIVDLLRNDLSRSCRPGSVKVTGLCEVELFETVQHLVSTVIGELRDDRDIWHLCAGCFPGGSITGAPKIRAMQIISELERSVRGAYCGSIFYAGPQGDFDSSILIRTFTLKDGRVQFPVGGGIVADSVAEDEYRETLHKASGMLRVLDVGR